MRLLGKCVVAVLIAPVIGCHDTSGPPALPANYMLVGVNVAAAVPLKLTAVVPARPAPLIRTVAPTGALTGPNDEIDGFVGTAASSQLPRPLHRS